MGKARNHVVLVGMMGSGKTTVGRRVARALDCPFVDSDEEIVAASGRSIGHWFVEPGEAAFRDAEAAMIAELLNRPKRVVIATGGGAVMRESTRQLLVASEATVVWLRAGVPFLASRVNQSGSKSQRPLLTPDPIDALRKLDKQRRHFYAQVADIIVDIESVMHEAPKPKQAVADLIVATLPVLNGSAA